MPIFIGLHCHSASSLRVLADKSVSSLQTTGYCGNLLPIKKRLLVHHCIPLIDQCHFHLPISHTKHIFPLQHFSLTLFLGLCEWDFEINFTTTDRNLQQSLALSCQTSIFSSHNQWLLEGQQDVSRSV